MKSKPRNTSRKTAQISAQDKVLRAILAQIPFDGWTDSALQQGLKQAGISAGKGSLMFPQGVRDVIELFGQMADKEMLERIKKEPGFVRFRVRDKIAFAVRARLEAFEPYKEAVRRMMIWYAAPTHLPLGLKRLYRTVDLMWRAAGDTATDFNHYTKRGLLAAVLNTTMMFWLDDSSPGHRASWEFLDRRIGEVLKVGKTMSLMKEWKPAEIVEMVRSRVSRAR
jgi:ubiquinone biosynthesis protein COQ9